MWEEAQTPGGSASAVFPGLLRRSEVGLGRVPETFAEVRGKLPCAVSNASRPVNRIVVTKAPTACWNRGSPLPRLSCGLRVGLTRRQDPDNRSLKDTMFARGLKRKCVGHEEDVEGALAGLKTVSSYSLQRQSLLDMSLVKLQLCHMLVEPNLCRSVLIANTVRQIQEEMTQDGTWRAVAPQAAGRAPLDRLVSTEILCRAAWEQEGACPAPGLGDGHTQGPVSDLCPVTSAQAPRHPQSSVWEMDGPRENRGSFHKSLDQIFETLETKNPSCMEELFSDVDSPYYDLDTVLTGMMGGARPGPCEGLEGLAPATPGPSASCKSDLGELDHVVEILVET
nr:cell division cycle-associated protein 4 isoform X1 [Macaca nemestrina]